MPGPTTLPEPVRTCIGCRSRLDRRELVRWVVSGGRLIPGAGQPGRGAWLCRASLVSCFDSATKGRRWNRAFRGAVSAESVSAVRDTLIDGLP